MTHMPSKYDQSQFQTSIKYFPFCQPEIEAKIFSVKHVIFDSLGIQFNAEKTKYTLSRPVEPSAVLAEPNANLTENIF
jgi:hypothetical protein